MRCLICGNLKHSVGREWMAGSASEVEKDKSNEGATRRLSSKAGRMDRVKEEFKQK